MIDLSNILQLLREHSDILVTRDYIGTGASEETLQGVEAILGVPLDPWLRLFFSQYNGIAIEWVHKDGPHYRPPEDLEEEEQDEIPHLLELLEGNEAEVDGRIIVMPIEEVLVASYESSNSFTDFGTCDGFYEYLEMAGQVETSGPYSFDGREFESEAAFRSQLRYIDFFDPNFGVVLLFEPGISNPILYFSPQHGGEFDEHCKLSLSQYLQLVLQHFGQVKNRKVFFEAPFLVQNNLDYPNRLVQIAAECLES